MYKMYDDKHRYITNSFYLKLDKKGTEYWEHGANKSEILAERNKKLAIKKDEEIRKKNAEFIKENKAQIQRAIKLAKYIVKNIEVTYEEARNIGYCRAGIANFLHTKFNDKDIKVLKIGQLARFDEAKKLVNSKLEQAIIARYLSKIS